MFLTILNLRFT